MFLIVGLGNPESDYAKTRHNMGFNVINNLSKELNIEVNKSKFKSLYGSGIVNGEKIILLKEMLFYLQRINFILNQVIYFVL